MLEFLYRMPNLQLFTLLSSFFIFISLIAIFLISRFLPFKLRYENNTVVGTVSSLISIIYGVLVGLTALYLINNINYTSDAVQREANAAAGIARNSQWLTPDKQADILQHVKEYLQQVINTEWSEMQAGQAVNKKGVLIIGKINLDLSQYNLQKTSDSIIMRDMLDEIKNLYDAREQRIHMSHYSLNKEMWTVILIGTALTIGINFLFGMNVYLHLICVAAVALMAATMVFLVLTLERPFQGEFVIKPEALQAVLNLIENKAFENANIFRSTSP